ncbi:MAG: flagellar motor protein MotB, partial [Spirochaetales bacterium]|nr:flagellar motor protein MotB [Spirochaetales bacterium]
QDLGYSGITSTFPDPFTLTGSVSGNILENDDFTIRVSSDISLPGFKSLLLTLGGNINFRDIISLNLGTRFDLDSLINGNPYGMIPSIGINYSFKTDIKEDSTFSGLNKRGWNKSEVNIQSGFSQINEKLWAAGLGVNIPLGLIDKSPPVIELDISGFESEKAPADEKSSNSKDSSEDTTVSKLPVKAYSEKGKVFSLTVSSGKSKLKVNNSIIIRPVAEEKSSYKGIYDKRYPDIGIAFYISPNNDGIRDSLTFPINISDSRYLSGYAFLIKDSDGRIVREIKNKEKRIENQGFKGFFDRLFSVKTQIEIPSEFRWDGLDNNGAVVDDGLYFFSVEAWDDNGNRGSSPDYGIVVDGTSPAIDITEPEDGEKIFSPNNDGNKDTITIVQTGSEEDFWSAEFIDSSGNPVKTVEWKDSTPTKFIWDGRSDEGRLVPDGVYSYKIESRDRAGNSTVEGFSNIIKNTEETPITLSIDKSYFSPNNDKILDSLLFFLEIPVTEGIISWDLTILDGKGLTRRVFSGNKESALNLIFDGRDQDGIRLEEGAYTGRIEVFYINGNNPIANSPLFYIDVTSPSAKVKSSNSVFSPNGDGLKDQISFYQESTMETSWSGIVRSSDGTIITEYDWPGAAEPVIVWNGTLSDGRLAPDGEYTYQLISIDRAGNTGQSELIEFILDTEATPVILTTDLDQFSPNNDSEKDTITIIPEIKVKDGIDTYSLDILDSNNNTVRSFFGKNIIPEKFIWNGIGDSGKRAEDGVYSSRLTIVYLKGNSPTAQSRSFVIDTVYPEISAGTEFLLFSPDGDGRKDSITVAQTSSTEDIWYGDIISSDGKVVKSYIWKKNTPDFTWDATDNEGNPVSDGSYTYSVYSMDPAGNKSSAQITDIIVDTKPTAIFLTLKDKYISPTGNGLYEDLTFSTIVNNKTGLDSWFLRIYHETEGLIKEFSGVSTIPKNIIWNGVNENGKITEGYYYAKFSVSYTKGNFPSVSSSKFLLD